VLVGLALIGPLGAILAMPVTAAARDVFRYAFERASGMPQPTVPGHLGEFVAGRLEGVPVILQRGRLHLYEGHDPATAVFPVRLMAALGVEVLIVTNAAGGIRPAMRPPALMLISDHLNLTGRSPLVGPAAEGEPRFPDMSAAYDPGLRSLAREVARAAGVTLHEGVYAGLLGPSFETPAAQTITVNGITVAVAAPSCQGVSTSRGYTAVGEVTIYDTNWQVTATATDPLTGAQSVLTQGVRIRLPNNFCP